MKLSRVLLAAARLLVVAFILLTSIYCLLAWIPFTYQQVVKGGLLPVLSVFVKWHPRIYWIAWLLAALTLLPDLRQPKTQAISLGFLTIAAAAGSWLNFHPVLDSLRNEVRSFYFSLVALLPLVALAAIDWIGNWERIAWADFERSEDRCIFQAAWQSGLFLALVYAVVFQLRSSLAIGAAEAAAAFAATLVSHLTVLLSIFVGAALIRSIAGLAPRPSATEFVLSNVAAASVAWAVIRVLIFKPVSFDGPLALASATALSVTIAATISGFSLRYWRGGEPASGFSIALFPFSLGRFRSGSMQAAKLASIAILAGVLAINTAVMDWNYLLQKLAALAIWVLTFSCMYVWRRHAPGSGPFTARGSMLLVAVLAMVAYRVTASAIGERPRWGGAIESYAGFDVSFRLIRDTLSPPPRDNSFYGFLRASTNIPRSVQIQPVNLDLVSALAPAGRRQPNIFLFVIDSLRRDYLSPYNKDVAFTPNLEAFARESAVFRNAFTRYGATGLSEPAIWVGGMVLHKQYVTPFYPMNTLEKLFRVENYQPFISMDTILNTVVERTPALVELDQNKLNMDFDFCSTAQELEGKMTAYRGNAPIFVYTQSQNMHVSVIQRQGGKPIDSTAYPGFYAPYASRLHRIDGCFGQFVQFMKERGIFDNSIVVFTADHGDSLGEQGRWGHAYSLVPEVVRIPLLIHLPASLRNLRYDPSAVAFSTDITPSLYYLLGHPPSQRDELFGGPLFTATDDERSMWHRDHYMIAASYAAVYAILSDEGRSLFIADAVNEQDSFWEMDDRSGHSSFAGSRTQNEGRKLIREGISRINAMYGFQPAK